MSMCVSVRFCCLGSTEMAVQEVEVEGVMKVTGEGGLSRGRSVRKSCRA